MILSDVTIREKLADGSLEIDPLEPENIQAASVDLTLLSEVLPTEDASFTARQKGGNTNDFLRMLDTIEDDPEDFIGTLTEVKTLRLYPGNFVLASTQERVKIPNDVVGILSGKSSLARLGLQVHSTAGFIDPGFEGTITLELTNVSPYILILHPGQKIAQIYFQQMTTPAERPYGHPELKNKYLGQFGPQVSKNHLDYVEDTQEPLHIFIKRN